MTAREERDNGVIWGGILAVLLCLFAYATGYEVGRTDSAVTGERLDTTCGHACMRLCDEVSHHDDP